MINSTNVTTLQPLLSMNTALSDIATRKRYNNNKILAGTWERG
jgi:hypothetical protein